MAEIDLAAMKQRFEECKERRARLQGRRDESESRKVDALKKLEKLGFTPKTARKEIERLLKSIDDLTDACEVGLKETEALLDAIDDN